MVAIVVLILVLAAVIVAWKSSTGTPFPESSGDTEPSPGVDGGRLILYGVSFIGLMGFLFAVMGLISVGLAQTVFASHNLMSANDARTQVSYYLAALIVATPLWLAFWRLVERRIDRSPAERRAPERRLYLALVFAIAGVVSLYAVHTVLRVLITLPAESGDGPLRDGVSALIRLLVCGGAWVYYTRLASREWPATERDPARDLALYVVSGFSLTFLAIGAWNLVGTTLQHMMVQGSETVLLPASGGSPWKAFGEPVAWIIAGGAFWAAATIYDARYPGVRAFRVPYLYVVSLVSAAATVGFGIDTLYEVVRLLLGYRPSVVWGFLPGTAPFVLVLGAIWAYHWQVLGRQAALAGRQFDPTDIPWPRRPYLAILTYAGLALAAVGAVTIIWVSLDAGFGTHDTLTGSAWWRDELSVGMALLLGGTALWLRPWQTLQAAAEASARERGSTARRWLLGAIILGAALIGVGFLIAFLWLILQMILGASHATDADNVSHAFKYLATALVAAGLALYHAIVLRADLRAGAGGGVRIRVSALVTPSAVAASSALSTRLAHEVTVVGYLSADTTESGVPLDALDARLDELAAAGASQALLILSPESAVVYPYTRNRPAPHADPAQPDVQVAPTTP